MSSEFEMSMVGELSFFLGLQIKQDHNCIFISQEKYVKNVIKKFGLENSQSKRTPEATHIKLTKNCEVEYVDHKLYKSMIDSLLYLIASRPYISYAVGVCTHFKSYLRSSHIMVFKGILKYVHGTYDFGILYFFGINFSLVGYCEVD